jgi:predicted metal-binding protein
MLGRLIARFFRSRERGPRLGYICLDAISEAEVEAARFGQIRLIKFVECDDIPGRYYRVQH